MTFKFIFLLGPSVRSYQLMGTMPIWQSFLLDQTGNSNPTCPKWNSCFSSGNLLSSCLSPYCHWAHTTIHSFTQAIILEVSTKISPFPDLLSTSWAILLDSSSKTDPHGSPARMPLTLEQVTVTASSQVSWFPVMTLVDHAPYSSQGKSSPLTYPQDPTWCVLNHHFDLTSHHWPSHSLCPGHVGQSCFASLPGMPLLRAASVSPFPFQLGYNFLTWPGKVVRFGKVTLVTKLLLSATLIIFIPSVILTSFFSFCASPEDFIGVNKAVEIGTKQIQGKGCRSGQYADIIAGYQKN